MVKETYWPNLQQTWWLCIQNCQLSTFISDNIPLASAYVVFISQLQKFDGRDHELLDRYGVYICAMKSDFSTCHSLPVLFRLPRTWLFMNNSLGVSRKAEDSYSTRTPGPCFQFSVESELHIWFCYFVYMILVTLCSVLCMSVFHVRSLSLDYRILNASVTLVPLITHFHTI